MGLGIDENYVFDDGGVAVIENVAGLRYPELGGFLGDLVEKIKLN